MDVAFNITRRCNKSCDYCYLKLANRSLSLESIQEIVESKKPNTVTITGGEPLMHPEIKDILEFLADQGNHIHLLSNGILLTENVLPTITETNAELHIIPNCPE